MLYLICYICILTYFSSSLTCFINSLHSRLSTFCYSHMCVCYLSSGIDPFSFKWAGLPTVLIKNKLMPFLVWFSPALKMNSEQLQMESYGCKLWIIYRIFFFSVSLFCFCSMYNRINRNLFGRHFDVCKPLIGCSN